MTSKMPVTKLKEYIPVFSCVSESKRLNNPRIFYETKGVTLKYCICENIWEVA